MATATKICKVCGREYPYCRTKKRDPNDFRWQDVACCPEHGQIYLKRIMISRGLIKETPDEVTPNESAAEPRDEVKANESAVVKEEGSSKKGKKTTSRTTKKASITADADKE